MSRPSERSSDLAPVGDGSARGGVESLRRLVSRLAAMFIERGVTLAVTFLVGVYLAKTLGAAEFGSYSLGLALVTMLGPLTSMGLNHIVTRDVVSEPGRAASILGTAITIRLVGSIIGATVAVPVCWWFISRDPTVLGVVAVLGVANVARATGAIEFLFFAWRRTTAMAWIKSAAVIVGGALAVAMVRDTSDALGAAYAKAAEYVALGAGLLIAYRFTELRGAFTLDRALLKPLLARGWPLILSAAAATLYLKIDQVMLSRMRSIEEVGVYAVAAQLSEVWYFVPEIIAASLFPSLLQAKQRGVEEYDRQYQRLIDALALMGFVIAAAVSLGAAPLINGLFGEQYRDAIPILGLHVWAAVFVFMRAAFSKFLIAEGMLIASLWTHGLGAVANILLNLVLIPTYGGLGAAAATLVSYFIASTGSLFLYAPTRRSGKMMLLGLLAPARYLMRAGSVAFARVR